MTLFRVIDAVIVEFSSVIYIVLLLGIFFYIRMWKLVIGVIDVWLIVIDSNYVNIALSSPNTEK